MENELANLHMVLNLAAQEPKGEAKTDVLHVRMEPELKEAIEAIVERHGTTMSAFLRKCCEVTVREYTEG